MEWQHQPLYKSQINIFNQKLKTGIRLIPVFLMYNFSMNILQEFDTIAAIATPIGTGGVGVIRISGDKSFEIIEQKAGKSLI